MTVGMVLAAIAFICAALVQLEIDVSWNVISYIQSPQDLMLNVVLFFSRKLCQSSHHPQRLS